MADKPLTLSVTVLRRSNVPSTTSLIAMVLSRWASPQVTGLEESLTCCGT